MNNIIEHTLLNLNEGNYKFQIIIIHKLKKKMIIVS